MVVHTLSTEVARFTLLVVQTKGGKVVSGVEVTDQTLSSKDLVGVGESGGLLKLLVGNLLFFSRSKASR